MAEPLQNGLQELRQARAESRGLYWAVGLFSFFANLLMLTGPIYMLQVYDRVLASRSEATLLALSMLVVFLYTVMGVLDYARGRIMGRVGARFQARLDRRVFDASLRRSTTARAPSGPPSLQDLEAVQRLMTSPVLMALFDMPWTPIFLVGIWIFHPALGTMALCGGLLLIGVTWANQAWSRQALTTQAAAGAHSDILSQQLRAEAEVIQSLGMRRAAFRRWYQARGQALTAGIAAADVGGGFGALSKTLRLLLQSAMLGLGAFLVLKGELTPGAMIAGSILLGRALAPIELAIGQWPLVQRARGGWTALARLLAEVPPEPAKTPLPPPKARLLVDQITIVPPSISPGDQHPALRGLSFALEPGQACGVIGPSGAGKSTLARALTGVWRPAMGSIRLDGAPLDNYDADILGRYIGYLPQRVQLFDGTIADNIARLDPTPDPAAIHAAAKRAGAYDMILQFPDGFDTPINSTGGRLSGGQVQRIGLARAMYGDPTLLILDEPNSNLDNDGNERLNHAIRDYKADGHAILIMAHRPAAIAQCDLLLMIENGMRRAFGPKDEVLRAVVQNHSQITPAPGAAKGES